MDKIAIVVLRVGDPEWRIILGSVKRKCSQCGHEVMVAPTSLAVMSEAHELWCVQCVHANHVRTGDKMTILPQTPGQKAEIEGYKLRN